jgi:hypothetical protein
MRITYEIVTAESAEQGDAAERGFVEPRFQMRVPIDEVMANAIDWPKESLEWSLREAEQYLGRQGMEDSGRWFNSCDPDRDLQTGDETYESLHPPENITPSSYARLARIFCWRQR